MIGTGRAKYDNLKRFFEGYIAPHSILCTDSAHGYGKLAIQLDLEHKAIPIRKTYERHLSYPTYQRIS